MCVCACVCVCVRARVCVCVWVCGWVGVTHTSFCTTCGIIRECVWDVICLFTHRIGSLLVYECQCPCLCICLSVCLTEWCSSCGENAGDQSQLEASIPQVQLHSRCVGTQVCVCMRASVRACVRACVSVLCIPVHTHVCMPFLPFRIARTVVETEGCGIVELKLAGNALQVSLQCVH